MNPEYQKLVNEIEKLKEKLEELEEEETDEYTPDDEFEEEYDEIYAGKTPISDQLADIVAGKFGSWSFLFGFFFCLFSWISYNLYSPIKFDAPPFILLNLILSIMAVMLTSIVMISQRRQDVKDRTRSQMIFELCQSILGTVDEIQKAQERNNE